MFVFDAIIRNCKMMYISARTCERAVRDVERVDIWREVAREVAERRQQTPDERRLPVSHLVHDVRHEGA